MPSVEYDLRYLRSGISSLEDYLLSNDLFWPVGAPPPSGEPPYPRLTLGGLLLAQKRLHARTLNNTELSELAALDEQMDNVRARWRTAWSQKAGIEWSARLNLWRNFINDYREKPDNHWDRYPYEVSRRVQLRLLGEETRSIPASEASLLEGLDGFVRSALKQGDFIWDRDFIEGFPPDQYWYLYGRLPRDRS